MFLRSGNKGLYCMIKLHDIENELFCVLSFLASVLDNLLISENYFLTMLGL